MPEASGLGPPSLAQILRCFGLTPQGETGTMDSRHDQPHNGQDGGADEGRGGNGNTHPRQNAVPRQTKQGVTMPGGFRLIALAVIAAGGAYLLVSGLREPPMLEPRMVGGLDGYRLEIGRTTPAAGNALNKEFVAAAGVRREKVLQRLSEFSATWKVANPRIALKTADASGEANAFAEQLEGWLAQYDLLASSAVSDAPDMASIPGATLPAPPLAGLLIRCRERDDAIARDLALALVPVMGGEVNIVFDERVSAHRVQVAIVGAPRFGEDGVAYFKAV
ncbi:MAG: hypothetical protein V2I82_08230 [Halieaceae bacterium]|jgi:hypothetical protein|nr:hypothetical protein [Halieaceae bacterium]